MEKSRKHTIQVVCGPLDGDIPNCPKSPPLGHFIYYEGDGIAKGYEARYTFNGYNYVFCDYVVAQY